MRCRSSTSPPFSALEPGGNRVVSEVVDGISTTDRYLRPNRRAAERALAARRRPIPAPSSRRCKGRQHQPQELWGDRRVSNLGKRYFVTRRCRSSFVARVRESRRFAPNSGPPECTTVPPNRPGSWRHFWRRVATTSSEETHPPCLASISPDAFCSTRAQCVYAACLLRYSRLPGTSRSRRSNTSIAAV
jgi:hypothetical protein